MAVVYEDLIGKHVLVTGGATGLGYAIARAFSANQSKVTIVGRNGDRLRQAAKEMGGIVVTRSFDLTEMAQIPRFVDQLQKEQGEIDVLVNNAGINMKKAALAVSDQEFLNVIQTNQVAVFSLTREVAKPMLARRSGAILMISSMSAHYGIPEVVAYTASKAAVEGMTRQLAVEWSPSGVRVNCIAPGFLVTPMSSRALDNDPSRKARVLGRTPMGQLGEPADVGMAALFLASSQAKYITGVVLPVDGGNSIGF
jgi:NAD(P)-dependent dehydrogenase (short-subunit alcohol dehydrogenase family)